MKPSISICLTVALSFCANYAFAQDPGSYSPGTGGYHTSTGIAIGAAAAGVGIAYLVLHNHAHGEVTGCIQSSSAAEMTLLSDNKKTSYTLINNLSVALKTGDRVALKGKKIRQSSGDFAFEVHGLAQDYGACEQ